MKEYILVLISVSFIASGVIFLNPWLDRNKSLKQSIRYIATLCVICIIFAPLGEGIKKILDFDFSRFTEALEPESNDSGESGDKYSEFFADALNKYGTEYINSHLEKEICNKFAIAEEECKVHTIFEYSEKTGEAKLSKTTVILSGKAIFKNPHRIEEYVREKFGGKCEVAIE